jgi:hypothetical protein
MDRSRFPCFGLERGSFKKKKKKLLKKLLKKKKKIDPKQRARVPRPVDPVLWAGLPRAHAVAAVADPQQVNPQA